MFQVSLSFTATVFALAACLQIESNNIGGVQWKNCPSAAGGQAMRANLSSHIQTILGGISEVPECGNGKWFQVANLSMSDPQQDCPTPWSVVNTPARSCVAPAIAPCDSSVFYDTSRLNYQRICGRAIGYVFNSPDAFATSRADDINAAYLDGVSVTHGQPRQHIWSFAAGHGAIANGFRCPCDNVDRGQAPLPPSFVGNNYFCDGEYNGALSLWNGEDCTSSCCTFNSPPWFNTALPAPTTDDVEVRICHDSGITDERVFLNTLLLYIQ